MCKVKINLSIWYWLPTVNHYFSSLKAEILPNCVSWCLEITLASHSNLDCFNVYLPVRTKRLGPKTLVTKTLSLPAKTLPISSLLPLLTWLQSSSGRLARGGLWLWTLPVSRLWRWSNNQAPPWHVRDCSCWRSDSSPATGPRAL